MTSSSPIVIIGSVVFAVAVTAAGAILLRVMFARARAKYEMPAADKGRVAYREQPEGRRGADRGSEEDPRRIER